MPYQEPNHEPEAQDHESWALSTKVWDAPIPGFLVHLGDGEAPADLRASPSAQLLSQSLTGGMEFLVELAMAAIRESKGQTAADTGLVGQTEDGRGKTVVLEAQPKPWAGAWWVQLVDITAEREAEADNRRQGQFLERLIETMPVALFVKDPQDSFRITRLNACFEETFGVRRKDWVGLCDGDLFEPELADGYRAADDAVFESGEVTSIDESIQTVRGLRAARTIKVPLYDEAGKPEMLLGILQDVEDMHVLVRRAEDASELKSRFLANVSHELRTPLYGILGMLREAREEADREVQNTALELAEESAQTLMGVVQDTLDLSEIEAGSLSLDIAAMEPVGAIEHTVRRLSAFTREQGVEVRIEEQRPDGGAAREVLGDRQRIQQIVTNLLSNAIKYSPPNGVVTVGVRVTPHGAGANSYDRIRIEVRDEGPGIPEDQRELIFQPFQQSSFRAPRSIGSTGLGLTIVGQLVALMDAKIEVESTVGEGSVFRVDLVLKTAPVVPAAGPVGRQGCAEPTRGVPAASVLVAEDNAVNQRIVARMLENAGHSCTIARDGQEALEILLEGEHSFDFALIDMQMPRLDGISTVKAIRSAEKELQVFHPSSRLPVAIVTANAMKGDDVDCIKAGADGYLTKPFRADELLAELARLDRRPGAAGATDAA